MEEEPNYQTQGSCWISTVTCFSHKMSTIWMHMHPLYYINLLLAVNIVYISPCTDCTYIYILGLFQWILM